MKLRIITIILLILTVLTCCSFRYETAHEFFPINWGSPPKSPQEILSSMTLDEKIGQLIIAGIPESYDQALLDQYISNYKVGGFILFSRNFNSFDSLYNLNKKLKAKNAKNKLPLFLSLDEEGGKVSRLPSGAAKFPNIRLVGDTNRLDLIRDMGFVIGRELTASGFNLDFAPVLDIVDNASYKLLYDRSFGDTPLIVTNSARSFIQGLMKNNIIAAAKHFPGHGRAKSDSHLETPVINITKEKLLQWELVPYKENIEYGLDMIMIGHLSLPLIDKSGYPASMSKTIISDILRDELKFDGIAITDDIDMKGFAYEILTFDQCVTTAFDAGIDIFLICHNQSNVDRTFNALKSAVQNMKISEERLNESVLRIIKLKQKYKLSDDMRYTKEIAQRIFGSNANKLIKTKLEKELKNK